MADSGSVKRRKVAHATKTNSRSISAARAKLSKGGPSSSAPTGRLSTSELKWRAVPTSSISALDDGGGMMMLEELDDVGVEWDDDGRGAKVARFVHANGSRKGKGKSVAEDTRSADLDSPPELAQVVADKTQRLERSGVPGAQHDPVKKAMAKVKPISIKKARQEAMETDVLPSFARLKAEDMNRADHSIQVKQNAFSDKQLPGWRSIPLDPTLKQALHAADFLQPTEIQARALPFALKGRDVVGVAETGSGKTLAYCLPILSSILNGPPPSSGERRDLSALVLCPTRELAIQVVEHLKKLLDHAFPQRTGPPRISVGSVVGGLSAQKQKRIVERGCDILVATPGRLWDLLKADEDLAKGVRGLRFLIIDEADRMIENGHFVELESIVRLTQRTGQITAGPDDDDPVFSITRETAEEPREDMQTFIFSATLSKDLQQNLKRRSRGGPSKKGQRRATALEDLVERLDFRDPNPEVIDLSPQGGLVSTIKESLIHCVSTEKDLYLYYFLLRYPGRTLIFVNSIDSIRRLLPLFSTLQVPIFPLHSQLQQKQRLKNLDRFRSNTNVALIATDVAARGLDISNVDHVVHFSLPRTADTYIHRSGRTGRAKRDGVVVGLVAPEEQSLRNALVKSLGRKGELMEMPIEAGFLPSLKERVSVAKEIEKAEHQNRKEKHDKSWLEEAAEALDVDIDREIFSDDEEGPKMKIKGQHAGKTKSSTKVLNLKAQLKSLLSEPLVARGVSAKYPTSGSKVIVDDLIGGKGHGVLLGANKGRAYDEELLNGKKRGGAGKRKRA